eukprot:jgi/Hompol1/4929/HPOL_004037-RA
MLVKISSNPVTIRISHVGTKRNPISSLEILSVSPTEHIVALHGSFCDGEIIQIDPKSLSITDRISPENDEFEDISDISGFKTNVTTLNAFTLAVEGYLAQVYDQGVILSSYAMIMNHHSSDSLPQQQPVYTWSSLPGQHVICSAISGDNIAIGQSGQSLNVTLLRVTKTIDTPHSIQFLESEMIDSPSHLLIGIRHGALLDVSLSCDPVAQAFTTTQMRSISLGVIPLNVVAAHHSKSESPFVLALSSQPWRISLSPLGDLSVEPVLLNRMDHATPFRIRKAQNGTDCFIFLNNKELVLAHVEQRSRHSSRAIHTGDKPRRVLVDPVTRMLILATATGPAEAERSVIRIFDPATSQCLLSHPLPNGETIHSLAVWHVKRDKRYICVGTQTQDEKGRLLPVALKLLGECAMSGPVLAICTFVNSYLLASAGSVLYQVKIEATTRT